MIGFTTIKRFTKSTDEKIADKILSNYESKHDYEDIKKSMDEDLELYQQGKLEVKALGEDWV